MRTRRQVLVALGTGALAAPLAAFADQATKSYRIGFLSPEASSDQSQAKRLEALRSGLRDLGYTESIIIETRWAEGKYDRLPALASELVALKVGVIVTAGSQATVAAKNASTTIPIVMGSAGDPIALGLTTNLARPTGNITGRTNIGPELGPKLVELLKDAATRITLVGYLVNPANSSPTLPPAMNSAAKSLQLGLKLFHARTPTQIDSAFAEMMKDRADAVIVQGDPLFDVNVQKIAQLALKHRLASASSIREFAEVGGLIAHGPNRLEGYRRAAVFVDKLLKGAKPGDLAIEQPTTFELVINLRTAKALGLAVPQSLLLRANEVIQ